MTRSSPTSRLISVDLPTFGLPTTQTRIDRSASSADVGGRLDARKRDLDDVVDAPAVGRGNRDRLAEAEAVELRGDYAWVAVLALVDRDGHRLAAPAQHVRDEAVGGVEARLAINQEHDAVGFLDGARGLARHQLVHAARRLDQAAGVDDDETMRLDTAIAVLAVAGQARNVGDQGVARAASGH